MRMTEPLIEVKVRCFECAKEFRFVGEFPYGYDPEEDRIACLTCCERLGDDTMHPCLSCGAQFQQEGWRIFRPEACSPECGDAIDLAVDRAQERDLAREQARLEAM